MLKPTPRVEQATGEGACTPALVDLFESEETPLLRYAFSLTGRRTVAEDIVQEAFLGLHQRWNEVDSPRAWLFRSVRNRAFDHLRNHKREVSGGTVDGDGPMPCSCPDDETPEAMLLRMEAMGVLRRTLNDLSPADQKLVKLKYFQGLKYSDISDQTGLSAGNVGYRLHHVLKKLADKLRRRGIDGEP